MKKIIIVSLILTSAYAGMKVFKFEPWASRKPEVSNFEPWTNDGGKTVQLKLLHTKMIGDELFGVFLTKENKTVEVASSKFNSESVDKLQKIEPIHSVFDKHFTNNLVKLKDNKMEPTGAQIPNKYYIFYYTASWCPPCQKFTPSLVQFYNQNKNNDFEIVLISSDKSEADMTRYAVAKKMPWPQLKFDKVSSFKQAFPNGLRGIPGIMVTDLEGNIIKVDNAFSALPELKKLIST